MSLKQIRIVGTGQTALGRLNRTADDLCSEAIHKALKNANMKLEELNGIVAVPSLSHQHFMQAHYLATKLKIFPTDNFVLRTIDTGGSGPVSSIYAASALIRSEYCQNVAIVAGDAVLSLEGKEFLRRADNSVADPDGEDALPSPKIPHGYSKYAQYEINRGAVTREQLAMVPVIMSNLAVKHPQAMCKKPVTLDEVLNARKIAPVTTLLECARRADGAAACILSSSSWYDRRNTKRKNLGLDTKSLSQCPVVISTGEASGPLYPPANVEDISESLFSSEKAFQIAYNAAQLRPSEIDYFGLYDCYPICLMRSLSSSGLCKKGEQGNFIEEVYRKLLKTGEVDTSLFPVNTHGGLLCYGSPWETPALFTILEAVEQLNGTAGNRQVKGKGKDGKINRAVLYANGGVLSASAVAILGAGDIF